MKNIYINGIKASAGDWALFQIDFRLKRFHTVNMKLKNNSLFVTAIGG